MSALTGQKHTLALDPATATGFAHSNGTSGTWNLRGTGGQRLLDFRATLHAAAKQMPIERIAFEDASFGSHNPAVQCFHNELRGIIRLVAAELDIEAVGYKPNTIKKFATGNGRADKQQMMRACVRLLGTAPATSDEADALFILALDQAEQKRPTLKATKPAPRKNRPKENKLF